MATFSKGKLLRGFFFVLDLPVLVLILLAFISEDTVLALGLQPAAFGNIDNIGD